MNWTTVVLGHGLHVRVDDPELLPTALAALPPAEAPPIARLTFGVGDGLDGPVRLRPGLHRWLCWAGGARGVVDCTRWGGRVAVSGTVAREAQVLRDLVYVPAALFLATAYDRVPLHASAVVSAQGAVVLAGPSGIGKSTLAVAAARAGLPVLAEDVVYVERREGLWLHGHGGAAHLRPAVAARLGLPEIVRASLRPGGIRKAAVSLAQRTRARARSLGLVILERGVSGRTARVSPDDAVRMLTRTLEGGFTRFRDETPAAVALVAGGGAWRLAVDDRPERVLPVLQQLMTPSAWSR